MTGAGVPSTRGDVLLAVDQGTTNTKAMLVDPATGAVVAEASASTTVTFPQPGWVEQDADRLWNATVEAIDSCLAVRPDVKVLGLGISNQRETVVCWSRRTGRPLGPVLGWQDARTTTWCVELAHREADAAATVRQRTGLALDPMFSAPKFRAALDSALSDGAAPDDVAVGTVDSWLLWKLTGQHVGELGNASRTLLLDLTALDWHDELLSLFDISRSHLPQLLPSDATFGVTTDQFGRLPAGTPVLAVLADSHAALYHHGCTTPGTGKATYGTGTSVMSPTTDPAPGPHGIATTLAWHTGALATYAREGNIVATGSALDWMSRMIGASEEGSGGAHLTRLAAGVPDSGGVSFVPAFSGLGAPYWDRSAVGVVVGVSGGTTREHLARAALEAVAHQVTDVVEAMESDGSAQIGVLHADGGAVASRLLMQIQADLLGRPVEIAHTPAASALGVARLAAEQVGTPLPAPEPGRRIDPTPAAPSSSRPPRQSWRDAVDRARGAAVPHTNSSPSDETIERNNG